MSVKTIISESVNKNPLGLKEALSEELRARVAMVIEAKLNEEANVSSGPAQHGLDGKEEKADHADYMKKTHGVTTKYHGGDELSYHGPKANVRKAILNHYDDDHESAKEFHPHLF